MSNNLRHDYWNRDTLRAHGITKVRCEIYPNREYFDIEDDRVPLGIYQTRWPIYGKYRDDNHPNMKTPVVKIPLDQSCAQIYITYDCDLRCTYCQMGHMCTEKNISSEAPIQVWLDWLESMNDKLIQLYICGGEPMKPSVWPKTKAILEKALELDYRKVTIMTNGQHPIPEDFNYTSDKCMIGFLVGIDGMKEEHDAVRGMGTWDKAIAFMRSCEERGYWHPFWTTLQTKPDYDKLEEFLTFMKTEKLFTDAPNFVLVRPTGLATGINTVTSMTRNEVKFMHRWFESHHCLYMPTDKCSDHMLGLPLGPVYVNPQGKYVPCERLLHTDFGSISDLNVTPASAKAKMGSYKGLDCYGFQRGTNQEDALIVEPFNGFMAKALEEEIMGYPNNFDTLPDISTNEFGDGYPSTY